MRKSRLVQLLKSLKRQEFLQLGKFLNSPFFNSNEEVILLYDYLRNNRHHPKFDAPALTKEQVSKTIFAKHQEEYDYQPRRIRDCMSHLSRLVIEFLAILEAQDEAELNKDQLTLKAFSKRNLYKFFEEKAEQTLKKLESTPIKDFHFYKNMFALKEALYFHPDTPKLLDSIEQVSSMMEYLDLFYALAKLRISCELRFREQIMYEHYEIDLLDEIIKISQDKYAVNNDVFLIYSKLLALISEGYTTTVYEEIRTLYFSCLETIGKEEQKMILHCLINTLSSGMNKGIDGIQEVFELYKAGLQHEILILNNRITPESFSNIAVLGSKLGDFEWTRDFISKFEKNLDEDIREDTKLMSLAYWHFNKKEYDQTINLINEHKLPGKIFFIRTRALLTRTYLENFLIDASFYQVLISNTDAFRKQVIRNTLISDVKKKAYKNFIKFIKRIALLVNKKPANFQEKLRKIKTDIKNTDNLVARDWLLEKVNFLM